jgi:hypothetical protein
MCLVGAIHMSVAMTVHTREQHSHEYCHRHNLGVFQFLSWVTASCDAVVVLDCPSIPSTTRRPQLIFRVVQLNTSEGPLTH